MDKQKVKYTLYSLIILIFFTLAIARIISLKSPFDWLVISNDWIGFWGNVTGGLLGAFVALLVFGLQRKHYQDSVDKENNEFLDYFVFSHLAHIKEELILYKKDLSKSIERCEENDLMYPMFPVFNIGEAIYTEKIYSVSKSKIISREFCENYNFLFTEIRAINGLKEQNDSEALMFISANLDYRIQKCTKHSLIRMMTDEREFLEYIKLVNERWHGNFRYALETVERAIENIEKINNEYKQLS